MDIGIDGYNLAMPFGTGIATYGLTLAHTLQLMGHRITGVFGIDVGRDVSLREVQFYDRIARADQGNKTRREFRRERRRLWIDAVPPRRSLHGIEVPYTGRVELDGFSDHLPRFDRLVSADRLFEIAHRHFDLHGRFVTVRMADPPAIMHWTYPVPVRVAASRNIYTLHDLVPLKLPFTTLDKKRSYAGLVRACVTNGHHICTVSEASRRDILDEFDVAPAKVTNCYQAASLPPATLQQSAEDDGRAIEGIFNLTAKGYFLYFGAIEPKKNVGRLLEAYLSLGTKTPLVLVGARAWQSEGELRLAPHGQAAGSVIQLDYLPRPLLLKLVRSARAVTFPSLYEGFGLPVLEAMQLGVPVLTSNRGSLPEVAGDASILVDPYKVGEIAHALRTLDDDPALRTQLAKAGLEQARKFDQARFRERLAAMYDDVLR